MRRDLHKIYPYAQDRLVSVDYLLERDAWCDIVFKFALYRPGDDD